MNDKSLHEQKFRNLKMDTLGMILAMDIGMIKSAIRPFSIFTEELPEEDKRKLIKE